MADGVVVALDTANGHQWHVIKGIAQKREHFGIFGDTLCVSLGHELLLWQLPFRLHPQSGSPEPTPPPPSGALPPPIPVTLPPSPPPTSFPAPPAPKIGLATPSVLWSIQHSFHTYAVVGGLVLFVPKSAEEVTAVDALNVSSVAWTQPYQCATLLTLGSAGICWSQGMLTIFDVATGRPVRQSQHPTTASPLLWGSRRAVLVADSESVEAIALETGARIWNATVGPVLEDKTLYEDRQKAFIVLVSNSYYRSSFVALSQSTGEVHWVQEFYFNLRAGWDEDGPSMWVCRNDELVKFNIKEKSVERDGAICPMCKSRELLSIVPCGSATGKCGLFHSAKFFSLQALPYDGTAYYEKTLPDFGGTLVGNKIYVLNSQSWFRPPRTNLAVLNATTGERLWEVRLPVPIRRSYFEVVGDCLLVSGLVCVSPGDRKYSVSTLGRRFEFRGRLLRCAWNGRETTRSSCT